MRHRAKVCWLVFALIAASQVAAADTVTLMWDMSADSRVVGYRVYAGTQSGVYTTNSDVGNTTSFVLSNAVPGQRYYFAASAYAADGVEGPRSAEISGFSNAPPALTNPGNQTSGVGKAITLQLIGSDPYGEPVSYKATGLPAGLSLTQSTGLITGVPVSAGTNTVTATVTDGVLSNSKTFTWSITAPSTPPIVNLPPVLTNPGNQTSVVGKAITLQLVGTDPEGKPVSYLATGLPAGLALSATTGLISGIPKTAGPNTVTATVTDGVLSNSKTFTWSIVDDKIPPVVAITFPTSATRFTVNKGSLVLAGTATDNTGVVSVSWSNNRGGSGLATGTSPWMVTIPLQKEENVITITAMDKAGNLASRTITVTFN